MRCLTLTDERRTVSTDEIVRYPRRWPWPVRAAAAIAWMRRHRRSFDVVYATGLTPVARVGARIARRPVVVKIVSDPAWERATRGGLTTLSHPEFQRASTGSLRVRLMRLVRNRSVRGADAVVTPSAQLAADVTAWGAADVTVISNGVRWAGSPVERSDTRNSLHVLVVCRLIPLKRVDVLVDAATKADVDLTIIGDGPERAALDEKIRNAGVGSRVRLVGPMAHADVLERLSGSDALALASSHEGLPHVVLESLVVGTPVVTVPVGAVPDVVTDGVDGLIVEPPTVEGFADAFARLRDDAELRRRLRDGAAVAGRAWNFDQRVDDIERVLRGGRRRKADETARRLHRQDGPAQRTERRPAAQVRVACSVPRSGVRGDRTGRRP